MQDKPPQSQAAEIRPKEMRQELTHLSNLMGYQVLDENGDKLGVASDYIVNTCETYIIYILMEPVASLNIAPGSRVVIPFEAVTINSGVLDAQKKAIQLAPGSRAVLRCADFSRRAAAYANRLGGGGAGLLVKGGAHR